MRKTKRGAKVDTVSGQVQSLNDSVDELKTRIAKLNKSVEDMQTQLQNIQAQPQPGTAPGMARSPQAPASSSPQAPARLEPFRDRRLSSRRLLRCRIPIRAASATLMPADTSWPRASSRMCCTTIRSMTWPAPPSSTSAKSLTSKRSTTTQSAPTMPCWKASAATQGPRGATAQGPGAHC
jgi:TolA-binding protein